MGVLNYKKDNHIRRTLILVVWLLILYTKTNELNIIYLYFLDTSFSKVAFIIKSVYIFLYIYLFNNISLYILYGDFKI